MTPKREITSLATDTIVDAAAEIVRIDYWLEAMKRGVLGNGSCVREKRKYVKSDDEY